MNETDTISPGRTGSRDATCSAGRALLFVIPWGDKWRVITEHGASDMPLEKVAQLMTAWIQAQIHAGPHKCQKCGGDGLEEIQSGPYERKCSRCGGSGHE